jgi:hypothetical protein
MENSYVCQTLPAKAVAAALLVAAFLFARADATTLVPSQTFKTGTKIACVLDEHLDSSKLSYGTAFKLRVVDTSHPALVGAEIHGFITDVEPPAGLNRARVGFFLTSIHLPNGHKKSISAYVVNRGVVQINPVAQQASRQLSPMAGVPNGTVTPGPIAWQMRLGSGPSSVAQSSSPSLGGYIYAAKPHEPIIVPAGTSVTVELAQPLTIP